MERLHGCTDLDPVSVPSSQRQMPCAHRNSVGATLIDVSPLVQLADYSEGSMGPDIHPYPEGSESALMVRGHLWTHISAVVPS